MLIGAGRTDFEADLERLEGQLQSAPCAGRTAGGEAETRQLYSHFRLATLCGNPEPLAELDRAVDGAIAGRSHSPDLWLLKAQIALNVHRFDEALGFVRVEAAAANSPPGLLLVADVDLQQGRYAAAQAGIDRVLAETPTWDAFARAANLAAVMGRIDQAEQLYDAAEDELTAKEMRAFAWLRVQRGVMYVQRGHYEKGMSCYASARAAYSGYWLVEERIAELLGAQGEFDEAIDGYTRLYAWLAKPEWQHALGDLYSLSAQPELGEQWKRRALGSYRASVKRGEVHYYNHLADLCCELAGHEGEAVEWARKDVELRANFATMADLAWALYRVGATEEAKVWAEKALAAGAISAKLYFQAASIFAVAGMRERGAELMRMSLKINRKPPRARIPVLSGYRCG